VKIHLHEKGKVSDIQEAEIGSLKKELEKLSLTNMETEVEL